VTGKKILIILSALILIFIAVIIFYIFSRSGGSNKEVQPNQNETENSLENGLNPSPEALNESNSEKYQAGSFSFSYPNTADISGTGKSEDGEVTVIDLKDGAVIEISSVKSSTGAFSNIQTIMQSRGFSSSLMTAGNIPATQYKGQIVLPNGTIQQIATVLEWNGNVYKIQLMHTASSPNPEIESKYQSVVSSFRPF
jgi:hypothetical protein